jgi:hypothetical protein
MMRIRKIAFRKIAFAALLLLVACKNGDCEFGPVDEAERCAKACGPRSMRSFTKKDMGCNGAQPECICGSVDGGAP